jgi:hypothetical protein
MPKYNKLTEDGSIGRTPEEIKYARKFLNEFSFLNGREIEVLLEISKVIGENVEPGGLPRGTLAKVAENLGLKHKYKRMKGEQSIEKEYPYATYVGQIKQRATKKIIHAYFTIYLLHSLGLMHISLEDIQNELNKNKKEFQKAYINTLNPAFDLEGKKQDQFLYAIMTMNIEAIRNLTEEPPESPFIQRVEAKLQKIHEDRMAYENEAENNQNAP